MISWRQLMSPSRNVSVQESKGSFRDHNHLQSKTQPKIKSKGHHKCKTMSTNYTQQRPTTVRRKLSNSFEADKAFLLSNSNILEELHIVDLCDQKQTQRQITQTNSDINKLYKEIEKFSYHQRQIDSLQHQILTQRIRFKSQINTQLDQCQLKMNKITQLLKQKSNNHI